MAQLPRSLASPATTCVYEWNQAVETHGEVDAFPGSARRSADHDDRTIVQYCQRLCVKTGLERYASLRNGPPPHDSVGESFIRQGRPVPSRPPHLQPQHRDNQIPPRSPTCFTARRATGSRQEHRCIRLAGARALCAIKIMFKRLY